MKKFLVRTFMSFSIIFILMFGCTMLLEYKNKEKLQEEVKVEYQVKDGEIVVPDMPSKVDANLQFSEFYFFTGLAISFMAPILFYYYGGIEIINKRAFKSKILEGLFIILAYGIFSEVLIFPKILFSSFYRLRLVGLSMQSFTSFIGDYFKGNVEDLLIMLPVGIVIYLIYLKKKNWYIWMTAIIIIVSIGGNYLYPYIDEYTNELVDMEEGELKDKLLSLSKEAGIDNLEIKVIPKSYKTNSMNAYMTGIHNSRRIVFWDTTLNKLSEKEILSVAAHEMGHYKLNHIRNSMILEIIILILTVIAAHNILIRVKGKDYRTIDNLPFIIVVFNIMAILITPLETGYSRRIETQADEFAMEVTKDPITNGMLEIRFIESNLTPVDVNNIYKWMAYDHPTVRERIENSNKYTLEH